MKEIRENENLKIPKIGRGDFYIGPGLTTTFEGTITGGHPLFHELLEKMREIHNAKNADYGDGKQLGNFMEAEGFGVSAFRGILIRISDKYSRIKSLCKREGMEGEVKDESIEDTLLDMAIYSVLAIIMLREQRERGE